MFIFRALTSIELIGIVAGDEEEEAAAAAAATRLGTGIFEPPGDDIPPSTDEVNCAAVVAVVVEEEEVGAAPAEGFDFAAWLINNFLRDGVPEAATDAHRGESTGAGGIRRLK